MCEINFRFFLCIFIFPRNPLSRHQLYLQLKNELSTSSKVFLPVHDRIKAAALALLADGITTHSLNETANNLPNYVGWRVVEQYGNAKVESLIRSEMHKTAPLFDRQTAEIEFCKVVQSNDNYGKRYYR